MFTVSIEIAAQQSVLDALAHKLENMNPFFTGFGEDMMERAKRRFATATAPDGQRWEANSPVTIMRYLQSRGAFSAKTGKITAKGQTMASSKKPLKGATGDLARQFFTDVTNDTLTFGNSMIYAAMQHYGGTKAQFPNLWGDIPARPFMPITSSGQLDPSEVTLLTQQLSDYLAG